MNQVWPIARAYWNGVMVSLYTIAELEEYQSYQKHGWIVVILR